MLDKYVEDEAFEKKDYTKAPLSIADYDNCIFTHCNFANTDLSGTSFSECTFTGCDLSNVKLLKTGFKNIQFKGCKMLGLHFDNCEPFLFEVAFDNCTLNLSSFYKRKLVKTRFINCTLKEVDLAEADLSSTVFTNCDLAGAVFDNTNLEKTDLRTAYNYSIDPGKNKIKKARFSINGVAGLLDKYDIVIE
jgi:fluoroquinolone resistance protein